MKGPQMRPTITVQFAVLTATALLGLSACGSDSAEPATTDATETSAAAAAAAECAELKPVKLQLQWVTQAQFAGYYAAVDKGFYKEQCLDVTILEGGVDIVPQTQLATGAADYAISWVPKALASREQGANIVNVAQIFERSGTLQVSWKDSGIASSADLKGKKVGNWGFGNEFELFAGMTKSGLDPASDVELVQQNFDMQALLKKEIDAAQAMTYNEYAQLLEAKGADGKLYTADQFSVINWNDEGTAMLQDAVWANGDKLADAAYADQTQRFVNASIQGWVFCRDNADACVDIVVAKGSKLGKSHQQWQMNEINKLIWPSSAGIGTINQAQWDQTVKVAAETKNAEGATVLTKPVDAAAFTNDFVMKSHEAWGAAGVDVAHQFHVELDDVGLKLREQVQSSIACAEVIDRRQEPDAFVLSQDLCKPLAVVDVLAFDRLEDDLVDRKTVGFCGGQGGADAQLRLVDGVWHEVDGQHRLHVEMGGRLDRFGTASLIETISILFVDFRQHGEGTLTFRTTHKRLVREYGSRTNVDDGLERVAELEPQTFAGLATVARRGTRNHRIERQEIRRLNDRNRCHVLALPRNL